MNNGYYHNCKEWSGRTYTCSANLLIEAMSLVSRRRRASQGNIGSLQLHSLDGVLLYACMQRDLVAHTMGAGQILAETANCAVDNSFYTSLCHIANLCWSIHRPPRSINCLSCARHVHAMPHDGLICVGRGHWRIRTILLSQRVIAALLRWNYMVGKHRGTARALDRHLYHAQRIGPLGSGPQLQGCSGLRLGAASSRPMPLRPLGTLMRLPAKNTRSSHTVHQLPVTMGTLTRAIHFTILHPVHARLCMGPFALGKSLQVNGPA